MKKDFHFLKMALGGGISLVVSSLFINCDGGDSSGDSNVLGSDAE